MNKSGFPSQSNLSGPYDLVLNPSDFFSISDFDVADLLLNAWCILLLTEMPFRAEYFGTKTFKWPGTVGRKFVWPNFLAKTKAVHFQIKNEL